MMMFFAMMALVAGGDLDFAPYIPDTEEVARLEAGEALVQVARDRSGRNAAASVIGIVDIAAPPPEVWSVMVDCGRARAIVPHLKSCKVLEQAPDGAYDIREHVVGYTFLFPNVRNVFRSEYRQYEEIRFARTGGDLRIMEGVWRLAPLPEGRGTRVTYQARLAIGAPAPRFLIRRSVRADVPEILTSLRVEAERDANGGR